MFNLISLTENTTEKQQDYKAKDLGLIPGIVSPVIGTLVNIYYGNLGTYNWDRNF